jgi:hypothetical protein
LENVVTTLINERAWAPGKWTNSCQVFAARLYQMLSQKWKERD